MKNVSFYLVLGVAAVLTASACASKSVRKASPHEPVKEAASKASTDGGFDLSSIEGQEWHDVPELASVLFEFDQATLSPAARTALAANLRWLQAYPQVDVLVAGHTDDRGTIEYNIALGQRRAAAVASYYRAAGVAPGRLRTISYGEERSVCSDAVERCWAQNRRAETRARIAQESQAALE